MIKKLVLFLTLIAGLGSIVACSRPGGAGAATAPKLETEEQKTLYALGLLLGRNVKTLALNPDELAIVKAGLGDAATDAKQLVDLATYGPKVNDFAQKRAAAGAEETNKKDQVLAEDAKKKGAAFAETVAKQPGATTTPSGIVMRTITAGSGASPAVTDTVKVNYEGKFIDGKVFDSSIARGQPAEFQLTGVVPCWTEALQKMKKGEKSQIVCPSAVAYGDHSKGEIPAGSTLSFEVELLDFHK